MSILFDDASIQFAQRDETPVVSFPFAMACWIYIDDLTKTHTLIGLTDRNSNVNYFALEVEVGGLIRAKTVGQNGKIEVARTSTPVTANTWHHALGIWNGESDIDVYIDGVAQGMSPGSADGSGGIDPPIFFDSSGGMAGPAGLDTITIGRLTTLTPANYASGRIAEATIWDNSTSLTADEINDIAPDKLDPLLVRTDEIVFHTPLYDVTPNPTIDIIGSLNLTLFNAPVAADHPPLQYYDPETYARFRSGPIEWNFSPSDNFALLDPANWELERPASNNLLFQQQVQTNVIQINIAQSFGFSDQVNTQNTINVSISHNLSFSDPAGPTTEETIADAITFSDLASRGDIAFNDILFGDILVAEASKGISNSLSLSDLVGLQLDITIPLVDSLNFTDQALGIVDEPCQRHEYDPQGASLPVVTFGINTSVTLVCSGDSITLRNPTFGNSEEVNVDRALNRSRGGSINLVRDATWPKTTTHTISFSVLQRTKAQELLDFLLNCLGLQVTYTDYENRQWEGIITNPDSAVTDEGDCRYSAEIVMIGNPV